MNPSEEIPRWEHFPHIADMGVRGLGENLDEAFAQAALALTAVICDPADILPLEEIEIRCEAPDVELLLTDWLNALVYEMAVHKMLFSQFEVRIDGATLQAHARGEAVDRLRHQPAAEVKGATYTELKVSREKNGIWLSQCVVDI
ncbi:MAG: archease [Methylococcaceae bacterium]|nr:archease [Methylococcaceae bacterium]